MKAAAAIAIALFFATAAVAATPQLPMTAQFIPTAQGVPAAIRLTGRIPTRAAAERITIFAKECNTAFNRQVRMTRTAAGGSWEVTLGGSYGLSGDPVGVSGVIFRARWNSRWSVPWTFRQRHHPSVYRRADNRFEVQVSAPLNVDLRRKPVVLQRATGSGWAQFQSARLRLVPNTRGHVYGATFVVRQSGLTLRALVPQATARPCFNAGASANFTS
jgi:hypothetical protein